MKISKKALIIKSICFLLLTTNKAYSIDYSLDEERIPSKKASRQLSINSCSDENFLDSYEIKPSINQKRKTESSVKQKTNINNNILTIFFQHFCYLPQSPMFLMSSRT
ncbi:MAG: hypothetical protein K2X02_08530 [Alphaproteobacteria bacterium]|nr:hypothetical protein [Alphaproteobacteria bacterium]